MPKVTFAGKWPHCSSPENYALWKEAAHRLVPRYGFCEDCTPEYQKEMVMRSRCEHPETIFIEEEDGFISGMVLKYAKS